jgi:hypothetical protein
MSIWVAIANLFGRFNRNGCAPHEAAPLDPADAARFHHSLSEQD